MVLLTTTKQFEILRSEDLYQLTLSFIFAALTGLGAFIAIPLSFTPVPITLQTLFVLLSGFVLGRHYGPLSQFIYIILGIIGMPWFAHGTFGLSVLLGTTGGYLVGFVVSAYTVGWITDMSKQTRNPLALFTTAIIGTIIIYIFGILGLLQFFDLWKALELGFFPFIPGDLFKIILIYILLYLFIPNSDLTFDSGSTPTKNKIWNSLLLIIAFGTFIVFFAYLYSNGDNIPIYLPYFSTFTALCLLPEVILYVKNNKRKRDEPLTKDFKN